ncbi:transposable element Tcb1 transposase [Trichonephila clavipes]|uniref:Transposable element Tcb1 transposase n=1 Tax=Trichonephila clavipes TaxID=2585209 RepID=A0A8X6VRN5_TRICX|nr:transposable element Tcb1 transposase [Trichonephila clavipes]
MFDDSNKGKLGLLKNETIQPIKELIGLKCKEKKNFLKKILGPKTVLHVQIGTMTGQIYRDVILEQHVRLFRGAMGAEFVFMDDNARSLHANIVNECLQSEDITHMD